MNSKSVLVLLAVFVLLVGAFLAAPGKRVPEQPVDPYKSARPVFKDFKASAARTLVIAKGGRNLRLERKDAADWNLSSHENPKARSEPVSELLRALEDATVAEPRTGNLELFGLDDAERTELEVLGEGGASLLKLSIGRMSEFGRGFIRPPSGEVLEIDRNLDELCLVRTVNDARVLSPDLWYDLRILAFNPDDAVEFAIKKGHQVVRVLKVTPGPPPMPLETPKAEKPAAPGDSARKPPKPIWWIMEPEGAAADEQACLEIVNKAAHLSAQSYADDVPSESRGLEPPSTKTRIVLKDGTSHTLRLGRTEKEYAILQVEGRPEVWKVAAFNAEAFAKPLEKLKQEAQAPAKTKVEISTPEPTPTLKTIPPPARPEIPDPPAAIREQPSPPPSVLPAPSRSEAGPTAPQ